MFDSLKATLGDLHGQLESFAASCTGTIASARGEMESTLAGIGTEIEGIKTDIEGALGKAVSQVETIDQEIASLEP